MAKKTTEIQDTNMAAKKTTSPTTTTPTPKRPRTVTEPIAKKPARPRTRRQSTPLVTAEQIRERAYFLSLERGEGPADPEADWARAERELVGASKT
jgi:hypothetical protein